MLKKTLEITLFASSGLMGIGVSRLSLFLLKKGGGGPWYFLTVDFSHSSTRQNLFIGLYPLKEKEKERTAYINMGAQDIYIYTACINKQSHFEKITF